MPAASATLIVGLRNPGAEYAGTRHNVAEEIVRALGDRWGASFRRAPKRISAETAELNRSGDRIILALPRTFMNEAGRPVGDLVAYYGLTASDLVAVHDDIDLPFAKLRFQRGRGSGGHRGVDSVADRLGGYDFCRLKVGVGRPPEHLDPADYVLRRFTAEEREEMDVVVQEAADVLEAFVAEGFEAAVRVAGQRVVPPSS